MYSHCGREGTDDGLKTMTWELTDVRRESGVMLTTGCDKPSRG